MNAVESMRILDQLRQSLNQSAAEVSRHEQALESPLLTSDLSEERHTSWQRVLERFGERLLDCEARVHQAERQTQQDEAALAEHQDALTRFCEMVKATRQQLANVPPAI